MKKNSVNFHTLIAENFDKNYDRNNKFKERLKIWKYYINKYGDKSSLALDIGCGSCNLTIFLAEIVKKVLAIDPSEKMIKICKEKLKKFNISNVTLKNSHIEDFCQIEEQEKERKKERKV